MSYILDALRKSDQQRQQAKAPTLATAQSVPAPKPSRFAINAWLAAALIGAGILIGWLRPWQAQTPPAAPLPIAPSPIAPSPIAPSPIAPSPIAPSPIASSPAASPPRPPQPATPATALPVALPQYPDATAQPAPGTRQHAQPAGAQRTAAVTPSQQSGLPPAASNPAAIERADSTTMHPPAAAPASPVPLADSPEKRLLSMAELPTEIRQEMPALLIAFHQYSSAASERRVMINNSVLRQGEFIAPGLRLEQITPDGLVLSYRGYRFQRGVR